jgi:ferredoxin
MTTDSTRLSDFRSHGRDGMKIQADRDVCVGSGMCVLTAPRIFDQDDRDGRVTLLNDRPWPEETEAVRQAVDQCPSGALSVTAEA